MQVQVQTLKSQLEKTESMLHSQQVTLTNYLDEFLFLIPEKNSFDE